MTPAIIFIIIVVLGLLGGTILSSQAPIFSNTPHIVSDINKSAVSGLANGTKEALNNNSGLLNIRHSDPSKFDLWKWLGSIDWLNMLWQIFSAPFKAMAWLNELLSAIICWIMNAIGVKGFCNDWAGYILLVPLIIWGIWGIMSWIFDRSHQYGSILIYVLTAVFAIGMVLLFLGLL